MLSGWWVLGASEHASLWSQRRRSAAVRVFLVFLLTCTVGFPGSTPTKPVTSSGWLYNLSSMYNTDGISDDQI